MYIRTNNKLQPTGRVRRDFLRIGVRIHELKPNKVQIIEGSYNGGSDNGASTVVKINIL